MMCIVCPAGLRVSFDTVLYETIEGTPANITLLTSTANYTFPFEVLLMYMENDSITANESVDYIPFPDSVFFEASQERLSFELGVPDQVAELVEFLKIEIVGYSSCVGGLVVDGESTTAFVHIQDNDSECSGCGWAWEYEGLASQAYMFACCER